MAELLKLKTFTARTMTGAIEKDADHHGADGTGTYALRSVMRPVPHPYVIFFVYQNDACVNGSLGIPCFSKIIFEIGHW